MHTWAFRFLIAFGVLVGLWHMKLALEAVFVFRNEEPLASWFTVVLGPGFPLLGVLIASVIPRWGGAMLIAGEAIAFAIFAGARDALDAAPRFLQMFTLPSILLGVACFALCPYRSRPAPYAP